MKITASITLNNHQSDELVISEVLDAPDELVLLNHADGSEFRFKKSAAPTICAAIQQMAALPSAKAVPPRRKRGAKPVQSVLGGDTDAEF